MNILLKKCPSGTAPSPHKRNHCLDFPQCSLPLFLFKCPCLWVLCIILYMLVQGSYSLPCSIPVHEWPWLIYLLWCWWAGEWFLVGVHSGWCCRELSSASLDEYMGAFLLGRCSGATLSDHRIHMCGQFQQMTTWFPQNTGLHSHQQVQCFCGPTNAGFIHLFFILVILMSMGCMPF